MLLDRGCKINSACILATLILIRPISLAGVLADDYDATLTGAEFAQRALTWDLPLDKSFAGWIGTHNSYDLNPISSSVFEDPHNQILTITEQLELGIRYIEIDPHTIHLTADDPNSATTLICHADRDVAAIIRQHCQDDWTRCESLGLYDFGDETGCNPAAPTLSETVTDILNWQTKNPNELILLYIDAILTTETQNTIVSILGRNHIFSSSDFTGTWPTPRSLIANGITTILVANAATDIAFAKFPNAFNANKLENAPCPVNAEWGRVQGDSTNIQIQGTTHYNGTEAVGFIEPSDIRRLQNCDLAVLFDLYDESYLSASLWSWQSDPPLYTGERICAVLSSSGTWTTSPCSNLYYTACRDTTTSQWVLSTDKVAASGADSCPQGSQRATPVLASENADLVQVMKDAGIDFAWISVWSDQESCWAHANSLGPVCDRQRNYLSSDIHAQKAAKSSAMGKIVWPFAFYL